MKLSGRKLLFFLSPGVGEAVVSLPSGFVSWLLPDLSPAGRRSLLHLYQQEGLLAIEHLGGESQLRLTTDGFQALSGLLPLYTVKPDWDGQWVAVIFGKPPGSDREFRYLRTALLKHGAAPLTRGVYLYPGAFPQSLLHETQTRYAGNLTIVSVGEWLQGDLRSFINERYALIDLVQTYSGISRELSQLISKKKPFSALNHQEKSRLHSLFDRLFQAVREDFGLIPFFYPQSVTVQQLLPQLHSLF